MSKQYEPSVAILLRTYNGERFLEAQLDSLESQTVRDCKVYVSDDGPTDSTVEIIRHYQSKWGTDKIQYRVGPPKGFALDRRRQIPNRRLLIECPEHIDKKFIFGWIGIEKNKCKLCLIPLEIKIYLAIIFSQNNF